MFQNLSARLQEAIGKLRGGRGGRLSEKTLIRLCVRSV